jgi:hypothetical protein
MLANTRLLFLFFFFFFKQEYHPHSKTKNPKGPNYGVQKDYLKRPSKHKARKLTWEHPPKQIHGLQVHTIKDLHLQ